MFVLSICISGFCDRENKPLVLPVPSGGAGKCDFGVCVCAGLSWQQWLPVMPLSAYRGMYGGAPADLTAGA